MKRVLNYGFTGNKGGIETVALKVLKKVNRTEIAFDFLVFGNQIAYEQEFLSLGCNIYKLHETNNPLRRWIDFFRFFKMKRHEIDVFHWSACNLYSISPLFFAKLFKIKKIVLHSRQGDYIEKNFFNWIRHTIFKHIAPFFVDEFVSCSKVAARFMFPSFVVKKGKIRIIHNPVDIDDYKFSRTDREFVREKYKLKDLFVVGHVGVFLPFKNHIFLVDIFHEIKKRQPNSKLLLVGSGAEKTNIPKKIKDLGLENDVIFVGEVPKSAPYLSAMDVFLFPSINEGFPNVVIEAQTAGLQCFLSSAITSEVVFSKNLVEQISLKESAQKWALRILDKPSLCNRKIDDVYLNQLKIEKIVSLYQDLYLK